MLTIKRNNVTILINPDVSDYVKKQRNGIDYATLNFVQIGDAPTDLQLDDTVEVLGTTYSIVSQMPVVEKIGARKHRFQCVFEAEHYKIKRTKYLFLNAENDLKEIAFSITGNLELFIGLLKLNLDRDNLNKWQIGSVDLTETKTISFDNQNCLSVIATLVSYFQTEFWVNGNILNFTSKAKNTGLKFEYGQGKGLYNITRSNQDDSTPITRLYVRGGSRNLPAGYRNFATTLQLDAPIEEDTTLPLNEEAITFPEIYPQYLGIVTAIGDEFTFRASALPFDINAQLIAGLTAKVIFQTGMMAGYEIEISSFNNTTKEFVINTVTAETSLVIPSALIHAIVGDVFIVVDIQMPTQFITLAETQLLDFGTEFYRANNFHKRNYAVVADRLYFKSKAIKLEVADTVRLIDAPLAVDRLIPIESFKTFYAVSEWYNELTLSDYPVVDKYTKLVREQIKQAQNSLPTPPNQSVKIFPYQKEMVFANNTCASGTSSLPTLFAKNYTSLISMADAIAMADADSANFNVLGQSEANKSTCEIQQQYSISVYKRNGSPCDTASQVATTLYTKLTRFKLLPGDPLPPRTQYTEESGRFVWVYQDVNDSATIFYKNIGCTILADDGVYFGAWGDYTRNLGSGNGTAGVSCAVAPPVPSRDFSRFSAGVNYVNGSYSVRTVNGIVSRNISDGGDAGEVNVRVYLTDGIGGASILVLMNANEASTEFAKQFRIKNPEFTGITASISEIIWFEA